MAEDPNHPERIQFEEGKNIDRFIVYKKIGSGGYGDIYAVHDTEYGDQLCAMKVEFLCSEKQGLLDELEIMKHIQGSPYFPKLIADGEFEDFRYLVMELLGPSISTMRRALNHRHYTLYSTLKISIEMLKTIKAFHKRGYIHRDIKPGNFLIKPDANTPIVLIDFGLSETYIDPKTKKHIPPDPDAGFTGTCRYASLHAHEEKQLSRRDDLFSWFYTLIELIEGKVPWPGSRDRELTVEMKKSMKAPELCRSLTPEFCDIYKYIKSIKFKEKPKYGWIKTQIEGAIKKLNVADERYDWELLSQFKIESISLISLDFNNREVFYSSEFQPELDSSSKSSYSNPGCTAHCLIA